MPFNPNNFNYRNTFKDSAIFAAVEGGDAYFVSNEIGIEQVWDSPPTHDGMVMDSWRWGHSVLETIQRSDLVKLLRWTPGRLATREFFTAGEAPDVPALSDFMNDMLWQQGGEWHHANADIYLDPVLNWKATKGVAVMGVTEIAPGASATLHIAVPGGGPPVSLSEDRDAVPVGESSLDWTSVVHITVLADEPPVYVRIEIDTHKGVAKLSKSRTENGRATWVQRVTLAPGYHDLPLWPIWETKTTSGGPQYNGGLDIMPILPPAGTGMDLRAASAWTQWPWATFIVDSAGGGLGGFVNVDAYNGAVYEGFWGGVGAPAVGAVTPIVGVGDTIVPGQTLAHFLYESGGIPRVRKDPVTANKVELNLLVWRNLIGGALTTGDAVHGTLPHKQPVAAPPQSPEAVQIPPLTAVAPGGLGSGVVAIDPYGVPLGDVGNRGVLPV